MDFREKKEYIGIDNSIPFRFIVSKIKIAEDKSYKDIIYRNKDKVITFRNTQVSHIHFIEPIDNVSFFGMYINWFNFYQVGIHQDLHLAEQIKEAIMQSFITRSYVKEGTGKFTDYDFMLFNKVFPSLDINSFSLSC